MHVQASEMILKISAEMSHGCGGVQGDVVLTFTPEATGISWQAYVDLYCAGAKQLFFHEKPKVQLQLEPVTLSSL